MLLLRKITSESLLSRLTKKFPHLATRSDNPDVARLRGFMYRPTVSLRDIPASGLDLLLNTFHHFRGGITVHKGASLACVPVLLR